MSCLGYCAPYNACENACPPGTGASPTYEGLAQCFETCAITASTELTGPSSTNRGPLRTTSQKLGGSEHKFLSSLSEVANQVGGADQCYFEFESLLSDTSDPLSLEPSEFVQELLAKLALKLPLEVIIPNLLNSLEKIGGKSFDNTDQTAKLSIAIEFIRELIAAHLEP